MEGSREFEAERAAVAQIIAPLPPEHPAHHAFAAGAQAWEIWLLTDSYPEVARRLCRVVATNFVVKWKTTNAMFN
jgi:hypothetical protein